LLTFGSRGFYATASSGKKNWGNTFGFLKRGELWYNGVIDPADYPPLSESVWMNDDVTALLRE
jgi:hypothetical protein